MRVAVFPFPHMDGKRLNNIRELFVVALFPVMMRRILPAIRVSSRRFFF